MEEIVIRVPVEFKRLATAFEEIVAAVSAFEDRAPRGRSVDYGLHEQLVAELVGRVERETHRASLLALDVDADRVRIDDRLYQRVLFEGTHFHCRAGSVDVTRGLFREVGVRNGPTVDLVALRAGCVLGEWLPWTAAAMAHRVAQGPSRDAAATSEVEGTLPYSRSSFERVAHEVGSRMHDHRVDIEERLIRELTIPAEAATISLSIDRPSVPIVHDKKRPVGRPRKGAPKRPLDVVYEMGWTATLTLHDAGGTAIDTIRYGRMPNADPAMLADAIASDALALLKRRPGLRVVALADGGTDVQGLLDRHVDDESFGPVLRLLDFWHVVEKLGAAASVMRTDEPATAALLGDWRRRLCTRTSAVATILSELRDSGLEYVRVGDGHPVHEAITYLENNGSKMLYVSAREQGLPIGSGNVEATCKSLFGMRMKRPGAHWRYDTGAEVITMRAHALSHRWTRAAELAMPKSKVQVRAA